MEGKELVTSKKGAVIVQYRKAGEQNVCKLLILSQLCLQSHETKTVAMLSSKEKHKFSYIVT